MDKIKIKMRARESLRETLRDDASFNFPPDVIFVEFGRDPLPSKADEGSMMAVTKRKKKGDVLSRLK